MTTTKITLVPSAESAPENEHVFENHSQCVIGRGSDCDIQLPTDAAHVDVSRHHCLLDIDPPTIRVRDLGSRNGTYVNGEKIGQRPSNLTAEEAEANDGETHELKDGDELRVGHTVYLVGVVKSSGVPEPANSM